MAQHVRCPARSSAVYGVDASQSPARDNLFHLLVMLAVAMLMADHCLGPAFVQRLLDLQALRATHGDRLFECDQFRAACNADFDEIQSEMRKCAKTKQVRLELIGERSGIGADFRI